LGAGGMRESCEKETGGTRRAGSWLQLNQSWTDAGVKNVLAEF
jgi:hypothetical protein